MSDKLIPYIRQSRYKERTISLDDQRRSIESWASSNGVTLADAIVEQGVSGSKSWRERELGKAIEACERGEAAGIAVAFQDRLSRENGIGTAEVYETLQVARARLVATSEGLDTATGDHEMLFTIKAAIAREQWKRHRLNWANGRQAAIERGVHIGLPPAGYSASVVGVDASGKDIRGPLVPNEYADAVHEAFELRAKGTSWSKVAQHLTDRGVPTSRGSRRWSLQSARALLSNEAYLGVARSGDFRKEDAHPAIVDRSLWRRVQATRERRDATKRQDRSPLAKILRCANCGNAMALDHNDRSGFYRCRNRGACESKPTIGQQLVENMVFDWVAEQGVVVDANETPTLELEQAFDEAELELKAFVENTSIADIGAEAFNLGVDKRRRDRDEAKAAYEAAVPSEHALGVTSIEHLREQPVKVQRAVLAQIFERITVARGAGLERVVLVPRV
jgi:DNA invertase Pin-like site-specific DNA recombinase